MKGGPQPRVSSPAPGRSTLITSAPRSARVWPAQGPARMRASSSTRTPASGPCCGPDMSIEFLSRDFSLPPYTTLADAETLDGGLVDLDAEAGAVGQGDQAVLERQRPADDVLGQIEMREADAPIGLRHRAGELQRRRAGDARF